MTPEWLAAIASIGTFIVIAATAIAALVQLRHMRSSNQIIALNEFREALDSPFFRDASREVLMALPTVLEDPQVRRAVAEGAPLNTIEQLGPARTLANLFESFGAFANSGIVDRRLACYLWGDLFLNHWRVISPLIANVRAARNNPAIWENFEYLTALSRAFAKKYPHGIYPKNLRREAMPALWPELASKHNDG